MIWASGFGGVLKFIGDAVLAIFPIGERDVLSKACSQAHSTLRQAFQHMGHANKVRIANGEQALAFGTGLHRGCITYGNIGTSKRLDFTVIGPAVNEASRIESLCLPRLRLPVD